MGLKAYNSFGICHVESGEITATLFCFDDAGKMYKVIRSKRTPTPFPFVAAVALDLVPGNRPGFKVGFLNNPPGVQDAAKQIGLPLFLSQCAEELATLAFAVVPKSGD